MALDPSIPLGVRPQPFNNPFQALIAMREGEQQRASQAREDEQRATQLRQSQQRLDQDQAQINEVKAQRFSKQQILDGAERGYRAIKDGNADAILSAMKPEERVIVEGYLTSFAETKKARDAQAAEDGKQAAKLIQALNYQPVSAAVAIKLLGDVHPGAKDALEHIDNPAAFKKLIDHFATMGEKQPEGYTLAEGGKRFGPDNALVAENLKIADEPKTIDAAILAARNNPMELNRLLKLKKQEAEAGRAPASAGAPGPLEKIIGPDGKVVYATRENSIGKTPGAGTEKSSTGAQKRVLNFFNRAQQADADLEKLEPTIAKMNLAGQTYMQWAPNFAQTETGQLYQQAQRAFTEARLRKDSGAAIPEQEFKNDRQTYFAQPGDSETVLEQKRRGRAAVLASLGFESGQALGEFVGDTDEAAKIVEGYKTRSKATTPKSGGIKILKIEQVP